MNSKTLAVIFIPAILTAGGCKNNPLSISVQPADTEIKQKIFADLTEYYKCKSERIMRPVPALVLPVEPDSDAEMTAVYRHYAQELVEYINMIRAGCP